MNEKFIGWVIGTAFFAACCIDIPFILGSAAFASFVVWFSGIPFGWGWVLLIAATAYGPIRSRCRSRRF